MSDFYGKAYRGGRGSGFQDSTGQYGGGGRNNRPGKAGAAAGPRKPKKNPLRRKLGKLAEEARKAARKAWIAKRMFDPLNPMRKAKLLGKLLEWTIDNSIPDPWQFIDRGKEPVPGQDWSLSFDPAPTCSAECGDPIGPGATGLNLSSNATPCGFSFKCTPLQLVNWMPEDLEPFKVGSTTVSTAGKCLYFGIITSEDPVLRMKNYKGLGWVKPRTAKPYWVTPYYTPPVEPQPAVAPQVWPRPAPWPYFVPDGLPITAPAPQPMEVPFRAIPKVPRVSPWPQGRIHDEPDGPGWTDPRARGSADPGAGPSAETSGGAWKPGPPHMNAPPGPKDREKKKGYTKAQGLMKGVADDLGKYGGESADAIDAVYKALGKKCKGANTPQAKLKCIYDNFDSLDMAAAVYNLAENEAKDRAFGALGQVNKNASRKVFHEQRGRGLMTGGAGQRYHGPYLNF